MGPFPTGRGTASGHRAGVSQQWLSPRRSFSELQTQPSGLPQGPGPAASPGNSATQILGQHVTYPGLQVAAACWSSVRATPG